MESYKTYILLKIHTFDGEHIKRLLGPFKNELEASTLSYQFNSFDENEWDDYENEYLEEIASVESDIITIPDNRDFIENIGRYDAVVENIVKEYEENQRKMYKKFSQDD